MQIAKAIIFVGFYLTLSLPQSARSAEREPEVHFALLKYGTGNQWNPRPNGLPRLAWEIRKRTSIAMDMLTKSVEPQDDRLFDYPMVIWQGEEHFAPLSSAAVYNLRRYLTLGGTILIDLSSGVIDGGFHQAIKREFARIYPRSGFKRIPLDHVLYKTFYLIDRHGGRLNTQAFLEGIYVQERLAVILSANDLAGAISRDEFGAWEYNVGSGGKTVREITFRLGINILMYALCLDYKEDQVHIPFILKRRR
tara:strand:+ start:24 stop:776 length:753 start_codon:yes stop_codon:yes gene_type:complete